MLNVPAIFLQCSIEQMFSMFHHKTFMVNLAKTFNKNMESVPAWNMQRIGIDQMDGIAQIIPESIIKCDSQSIAQSPSLSKCCECETQSFSSVLSKIWTGFPLVPSIIKPFHHLVQDIPFSDMIRTFKM